MHQAPRNILQEKVLLGSLLSDVRLIQQIDPQLSRSDFFDGTLASVFEAIKKACDTSGSATTATEVAAELQRMGIEDGLDLLADLTQYGTSKWQGSLDIVKEYSQRRRLLRLLGDASAAAANEQTDVGKVLAGIESGLVRERRAEAGAGDLVGWSDSLNLAIASIGKPRRVVPTGFVALDEMLGGGLTPGEVTVVGARPSVGKTALVLNILQNAAAKHQSLLFSLEMSRESLTLRAISSYTGVDAQKIRCGNLSPAEEQRIRNCPKAIPWKLWIDDRGGLSLDQIVSRSKRVKAKTGLELIAIDYAQLVRAKAADRRNEVGEVSRGLKALAKEIDVPVLLLSQLNRRPADGDGEPRMSDLKESGDLEQDADVVVLLHREDYFHQGDETYVPTRIAKLIVAKQRNGPTGVVRLEWDDKTTTFKNPGQYPVGA